MAVIRWACPECEAETHFKGLCRECTEYDDAGNPVKPVHRVRLNHTPTTPNQYRKNKADFVNSRRKKPTNKQIEAMKEHLNAQSQALHLQHEHEHDCCANETCEHKGADEEDDFRPIGQAITDDAIGGEEE